VFLIIPYEEREREREMGKKKERDRKARIEFKNKTLLDTYHICISLEIKKRVLKSYRKSISHFISVSSVSQ
jgi:hypothetical protein